MKARYLGNLIVLKTSRKYAKLNFPKGNVHHSNLRYQNKTISVINVITIMYCNLTIVYTQGGEGKPLRGCREFGKQDWFRIKANFYRALLQLYRKVAKEKKRGNLIHTFAFKSWFVILIPFSILSTMHLLYIADHLVTILAFEVAVCSTDRRYCTYVRGNKTGWRCFQFGARAY